MLDVKLVGVALSPQIVDAVKNAHDVLLDEVYFHLRSKTLSHTAISTSSAISPKHVSSATVDIFFHT